MSRQGAHFLLSESINKQNFDICARYSTHSLIEKPLLTVKVRVQVHSFFRHSLYFFNENNVNTFQTVFFTDVQQAGILSTKIIPYMQENQALDYIIFMQDGVPPYIAAFVAIIWSTFLERTVT